MKERVKSIESLRFIAISAVILIHTTTRTLEASGFDVVGFSWTLFLNQISRFAVPLFFIISGFVLEINAREENYWSFLKRRFSKILFPYIIWSFFYYYLVYNNNHDSLGEVILTGNASYQLYFIPALLIFYLTFPLLHKLIYKIKNKILLILIIVFGIALLYKNYYIKAFDFGDSLNATILAYQYFIFGIIAAKNKNVIDKLVSKFKLFFAIPAVFLAIYVFWEGRSRYLITGNYLSYYSQWRPSIFIYTILVGLTFYYLFEHTKLKESLISMFSKYSFFVYFSHVAVLELFWNYIGKNLFYVTGSTLGKAIFDPIFFGTVTIASFLIGFLLYKIPKINRLIG